MAPSQTGATGAPIASKAQHPRILLGGSNVWAQNILRRGRNGRAIAEAVCIGLIAPFLPQLAREDAGSFALCDPDLSMKPYVALIGLTLCAVAGPAKADSAANAFFEPFETMDRGRWYRSDGWSNGEWMNCVWSRDAVRVEDGHLILEISEGADGLQCGEIQSRSEFGYGTFEVRMRTGAGSGLNAAFFTYIGPVHDRTHEEIDVEILLRDPETVTFNSFVDGVPHNGGTAPLTARSDDAFHSYAMHWTPDGITWFVDGRQVHQTALDTPLPEPPQKIYASLWGSDTLIDWMGPFDAASLPVRLEIDWIAFTPLGAACQTEGPTLCVDQ